MADLDLTQFEGHTPGPWWCHGQMWIEGGGVTLADLAGAYEADAALMTAAPALLAEVKRQAEEIERLRDALAYVVRAWESVPGGGMVHVNVIQRWLVKNMKPAIDSTREALEVQK